MNLPKHTKRSIISSSSENVRGNSRGVTIYGEECIAKTASQEFPFVINPATTVLEDFMFKTTYEYPDYEKELQTKKSLIDVDKIKDILLFPADDIKYVKQKRESSFEWLSLYGISEMNQICHLGRKNIELFSSDMISHALYFNYSHYRGDFTMLKSFKPIELSTISIESCAVSITTLKDTYRPTTILEQTDQFKNIHSGCLEMYPPLLDISTTVEQWIQNHQSKPKLVTLFDIPNESLCKLVIKNYDDVCAKDKNLFFIDCNACLKKSTSSKAATFEIQTNNKTLIFSASSLNSCEEWMKHISDSAGVIISGNKVKYNSNFKGNINIQETWSRCGINEIVQYSKESESINQKRRNESRFKIYHVYGGVLELQEMKPVEREVAYTAGDSSGIKVFFEYLDINMYLNYAEPFVIFFSVVDINESLKITEDFICDSMDSSLQKDLQYNSGFTSYNKVIISSPTLDNYFINSCVFNLPNMSESFYIVARVCKIFTSDIDKLWECYTKANTKYDAKLGKYFLESSEAAKKYLMPVGFSYMKLFQQNIINIESKFSILIKYDSKFALSDVCQAIKDFNDMRGKLPSVNISIKCNIKILDEKINLLSSSFEGIKPFAITDTKISREIQDIFKHRSFYGYTNPINLLYVNIQSATFLFSKSYIITDTKGKNFVIQLELYDNEKTENSQPLPLLFSQTRKPGLTTSVSTTTIFTSGFAHLLDEFKIMLPVVCMPNLHIVFTIHSVSYKETYEVKKKKSCDEIVGYSWIKLFDCDRIMASKMYDLAACTTLPKNYLDIDLTSMEKQKIPDTKWVDGQGKTIMSIELNYITNIHCQNAYLAKMIEYFIENGLTPGTIGQITNYLQSIRSLENRLIIIHMTTILNFLFDLLCKSSKLINTIRDKIFEFQRTVVHLLIEICGEITNLGREDMLRGYGQNLFNPKIQPYHENIHEILAAHLAPATRLGADATAMKHLKNASWFFFDIIIKSMAITSINSNRLLNRSGSINPQTVTNVIDILSVFVLNVKRTYDENMNASMKIIRILSKFVMDCFSIIDRGVGFNLLSILLENLDSTKKEIQLKFELLSQLANHEHFICLNLPTESPTNKNAISKLIRLTPEYCKNHFPMWLILTNVHKSLDQASEYRIYGIRIVRNLLIKHVFDDRYKSEEKYTRIHLLYLPFVTMLLDMIETLWISAVQCFSPKISMHIKDMDVNQDEPSKVEKKLKTIKTKTKTTSIHSEEETKNFTKKDVREIILILFCIIKAVDVGTMMDYLKLLDAKTDSIIADTDVLRENISTRVVNKTYFDKFITLLRIALVVFEKSDTSEKLMNPIGSVHSSTNHDYDAAISSYYKFMKKYKVDIDLALRNEIYLIILDFIDKIYFFFKKTIDSDTSSSYILKEIIDIHIYLLNINTAITVRKHQLASFRQIIANSYALLFKGSNNFCYLICVELLTISGSSVACIRSEAINLLYLIFRSDYCYTGMPYLRAYISSIMAVSKVVEKSISNKFLFDVVNLMTDLVKADQILQNGEFAVQVSEFTKRTKNIIKLMYKCKELYGNPESMADAYFSIANSFSGIPELRQTWLERLAELQTIFENYSEAAMCYIHISSIIGQTLVRKNILTKGLTFFNTITPNITSSEINFAEVALTDETKHTLKLFIENLVKAAKMFFKASRFEVIPLISKISIPFLEEQDNFTDLENTYSLLKEAYNKIITTKDKRYLGQYYRVLFYGLSFEEDHGCGYIYKEPSLTKLPVLVDRLKKIYSDKCVGLEIVQYSHKLKWQNMDQARDYIQINSVDQITSVSLRSTPQYYQHENVNKFVLCTPYTLDGKSHGSFDQQWQRISTFTTSHTFPHMKKRIPIIKTDIVELSPIESAINGFRTQIQSIRDAIEKLPTDLNNLEMKLQGSILMTVNSGPVPFAETFVKYDITGAYPEKQKKILTDLFIQYLEVCDEGLNLYAKIMKPSQQKLQLTMVAQLAALSRELSEILNITLPKKPSASDNEL